MNEEQKNWETTTQQTEYRVTIFKYSCLPYCAIDQWCRPTTSFVQHCIK